jgi:SAM-dependent methyltransferase
VQTMVLEAMARAPRYHRWILQSFDVQLGSRILEVGAGDGTVTRILLEDPEARVTALEPDPVRAARLRVRLGSEPALEIAEGDTTLLAGQVAAPRTLDADGARPTTVLYVNVLEHVADDVAELRRAGRLAGAGGRVCVFAPAMPQLYSRLDAELGHHRRYTRSSLCAAFERAGLAIERVAYFDRAGALAWWLMHRVAGLRIVPGTAALYDRLVPGLRALDIALPLPLGKNVIATGITEP